MSPRPATSRTVLALAALVAALGAWALVCGEVAPAPTATRPAPAAGVWDADAHREVVSHGVVPRAQQLARPSPGHAPSASPPVHPAARLGMGAGLLAHGPACPASVRDGSAPPRSGPLADRPTVHTAPACGPPARAV